MMPELYQIFANDQPLKCILSLDEALYWIEVIEKWVKDCQVEIWNLMTDEPYYLEGRVI